METSGQDDIYKKCGFENEREMMTMVCSVDLGTQEKIDRFNVWKEIDGTKQGLEKVISLNSR
jgi:hypothetical protein